MTTMEVADIGQVFGPNTYFLRLDVGSAKAHGNTYELATNSDGAPLVRSAKTGRFYCVPWAQLLQLAIDSGIDEG